jgi:hypothetical protein
MAEARQTSEGPLEPGATLVYRGTFLGRSYETPAFARPWPRASSSPSRAPPRRSTSRSTHVGASGGGHPGDELYQGESRGFFKVADPLLVRLTKKHFETVAENLRALLEDHAL